MEYCFDRQLNPLSLRCTGCCALDQRKHLHEKAGVNLDRGPCVGDLHLTGCVDDWCMTKQDLLEITVNTRYNVTAFASLGIRCNEISVIAN
jgi:hypothetical protein